MSDSEKTSDQQVPVSSEEQLTDQDLNQASGGAISAGTPKGWDQKKNAKV